jgi:hypothetical protein
MAAGRGCARASELGDVAGTRRFVESDEVLVWQAREINFRM